MDERRTFSSLVLQFTLAANLCTFFYLMTLSTRTPNGYYPLSMLVYSPAVYLLNKLFLSRPQTMRRLVLLNTAVGALFFLSILLLGEQKEMLMLVFAAGFCLWITMKGGYRGLHAPTLHEMILSLDTSAVMPVSYTHLDVYKRQVYTRRRVEQLLSHWGPPVAPVRVPRHGSGVWL